MPISAYSGDGLAEMWREVERHREAGTTSGARADRRAAQRVRWMWRAVEDRLLSSLRNDPAVAALVSELEQAVESGSLPPTEAAARVLAAYREV
jgi:LAO/AO transport system kinase